jgi:hypothetical protein
MLCNAPGSKQNVDICVEEYVGDHSFLGAHAGTPHLHQENGNPHSWCTGGHRKMNGLISHKFLKSNNHDHEQRVTHEEAKI